MAAQFKLKFANPFRRERRPNETLNMEYVEIGDVIHAPTHGAYNALVIGIEAVDLSGLIGRVYIIHVNYRVRDTLIYARIGSDSVETIARKQVANADTVWRKLVEWNHPLVALVESGAYSAAA